MAHDQLARKDAPRTVAVLRPVPLMPVVILRSLIAVAGFIGFGHAVLPELNPIDFAFWSQISAFLAASVATAGMVLALVRGGAAMPRWLAYARGATTNWMLVTFFVFLFLLGGDYGGITSATEHLIVPILVTIEWLWIGPRRRLSWAAPLLWIIVPLLYLPVYVMASLTRGEPLYGFLDPQDSSFGMWFGIMLVLFLILGFLVWLRNLAVRRVSPQRG